MRPLSLTFDCSLAMCCIVLCMLWPIVWGSTAACAIPRRPGPAQGPSYATQASATPSSLSPTCLPHLPQLPGAAVHSIPAGCGAPVPLPVLPSGALHRRVSSTLTAAACKQGEVCRTCTPYRAQHSACCPNILLPSTVPVRLARCRRTSRQKLKFVTGEAGKATLVQVRRLRGAQTAACTTWLSSRSLL